MSATLKDLREQRGKLVADMRSYKEATDAKCKTESRDWTGEEEQRYQKFFDDQDKLAKAIEREERQADLDREAAEQEYRRQQQGQQGRQGQQGEGRANPRATEEYRHAFGRFLTGGAQALTSDEFRSLQADNAPAGGFLVAPQQFVQELIKAVDNLVFMRGLATVYPIGMAQSLGAPSLDADPDDADWTSELRTGNEDNAMAFGKRELHPHPLAKRIKVSNRLLRMGMMGAEQLIRDRLGYKFGVTLEKAYMTGHGANQPLGVFTASSNGISTARDVATDNTSTAPTFDGLINAKFALKGQYWARASWIFHRDVLKTITKLKDNDGQYLWRPSVRDGEPDRLLDMPYRMSEYAPNTLTTGQYVGILGDFSYYWIADALDMQMQRLNELYAENNQVGFIGRLETDGMPVLEEAFVRVKLG